MTLQNNLSNMSYTTLYEFTACCSVWCCRASIFCDKINRMINITGVAHLYNLW